MAKGDLNVTDKVVYEWGKGREVWPEVHPAGKERKGIYRMNK